MICKRKQKNQVDKIPHLIFLGTASQKVKVLKNCMTTATNPSTHRKMLIMLERIGSKKARLAKTNSYKT